MESSASISINEYHAATGLCRDAVYYYKCMYILVIGYAHVIIGY